MADRHLERFVLQQSELKSRERATDFQINNVKQWLKNANKPIVEEEVAFVEQDDDLIPMVPNKKALLRRFVQRHDLLRLPCCLKEQKASPKSNYAKDQGLRVQPKEEYATV